ncbi:MAG: hypothetical protein ACOYON_04165 [Fimbriimonas sp.]
MVLLAALVALAPNLTIQVGQVDLNPSSPLPLGGYTERRGRPMEMGGEPLFARTILLSQGPSQLALVSVEMLTVPESLVREVRARIPAHINLFLASTHTHCAPDSQMLNERMVFPIPGIANFRKDQLPRVADRVAESVRLAMNQTPQVVRQAQYREALVQLNRARRPGGKPDPLAARLDLGLVPLTHFAAHATIHEAEFNRTNGDWPGELMRRTEGIALIGAIGDVSPAVDGPSAGDRVDRLVSGLVGAWRGSRAEGFDPTKEIRYAQGPIELGPPQPHPTFAKVYRVPDALALTVVRGFAPPEASITAWCFGSLLVIGVPGEPTGALGASLVELGKKAGYRHVWVVSHVNGWIGYILMPEDYDRGGYEATLSFHGRLISERILGATQRALRLLNR